VIAFLENFRQMILLRQVGKVSDEFT